MVDYAVRMQNLAMNIANERELLATVRAGGLSGICLLVAQQESGEKSTDGIIAWHEKHIQKLLKKYSTPMKKGNSNGKPN